MCYLTKGLRITFVDEREDRELTFYFEGGVVSFVRHLNKTRQALHQPPRDRSVRIERGIEDSQVQPHGPPGPSPAASSAWPRRSTPVGLRPRMDGA